MNIIRKEILPCIMSTSETAEEDLNIDENWNNSMARVSSASDIQDTLPAMVAFKWEASPGKPLKEANISEATLCPSLEHPLQPPPGRLTEENSAFIRASASKTSKNIAGSLRTKLFYAERESSKQENSLSPFKLASGRSLRDGGDTTRHMGYATPNYPNPLGGAASNRAHDTKRLGKLMERLQRFSFSGEDVTSSKDPPLDSLQLPPGRRPNDGFYLQYPRPLAVVKVNPASEVLKSGRTLAQKRLKKILGMERKPSSVVKSLSSDEGDREAPVRIFDLPESDVGSSSRCSAVKMRCNNLEGLHMKQSLDAHCFSDLGSKMFAKARRESGGLSDSGKEGGSPSASFELSKDNVDGYGGPISRKSSRRDSKGSHLAKCFPFDGSSKASNKRREGGDNDNDEEGDQNTTSPAFSRTSSPNCRGSKHGLRSCLSLPRRRTPSCQLMATMLMSLFPLKYDADSDEEPSVAVSECYSNQTQRHQSEEQGILVSSSPPTGTGIQFHGAEESSPRSFLDEYHPDNFALNSVAQLEAGKRPGERSPSVQTLDSSFLRKSCLETNYDHESAETSVSDYDHLHTLQDSKSPLHGAQQKSAAWRSSERLHESNILRCTSELETEVEYYSPDSSSSSSSDSEHPHNLTLFQDKAQQKIPERPLKDILRSSSSEKPSMSRRAFEPSSLNVEGSPVPTFVWSPILQLKDEETSAMRYSPQRKLQASSSPKGNSKHQNAEQESSPCSDFCKEHQNRPLSQLNTRPQIVATCKISPEKFTSGSDSLSHCVMRSGLENDSTSSRSNGENKVLNCVSDSTYKLSRNKLEKQLSPSLKISDAKITATKSHLHRLKPGLQLATKTLPTVISGPSDQDPSASCSSISQEEPSHDFRREISDSGMLALKAAKWTWSSDETFKDSTMGKTSAPPHNLQQQNSIPRSSLSEDNMLQAREKWISKPSSSLYFNPSAPSHDQTHVKSSSSSLQRSPSHVRHDEVEKLKCSARSLSVMSMVARWECKAGAGEASTSKSAPLQWTLESRLLKKLMDL